MCFALLFHKRINTQQILHILHISKTCKSHTSLWFISVAMTNVTLCYWKRASNNVNTALTCTVGGLKPCVRDMSWVSVPFKKEHCVCCSNWPRFICIVNIFLAGVDVVKLLIDVSDTVWKTAANVAKFVFRLIKFSYHFYVSAAKSELLLYRVLSNYGFHL